MRATLLLLVATAAYAHADCDACVGGWCHSRKTLLEGFRVTDQMAIDHTNDILYVQLNDNLNTAYHLKEQRVRLVQLQNTTGMTVDQDTQTLYTADESSVFKFATGSKTPETFFPHVYKGAKWLVYRNNLHYAENDELGLRYIQSETCYYYNTLPNYNITDMVSGSSSNIYFIADELIYVYDTVLDIGPDKLSPKNVNKLSKDKFEGVYYSDALLNAIFKLNEAGDAVEYAAYENGAVDQFVFDSNNNIVFHDKATGTVNQWQREGSQCKIEIYSKYIIKEV